MHHCPPEILAKFFELLHYSSLLTAARVCREWCNVINHDPTLQTLLFRRPRLGVRYDAPIRECTTLEGFQGTSPEIELHPALSKLTYYLGQDESTIGFRSVDSSGRSTLRPYLESQIVSDQIATPMVKSVQLEIAPRPEHHPLYSRLKVQVQNADGVRIADLFGAIVQECQATCDLVQVASSGRFYQRLGATAKAMGTKAHLLGQKRYYANLRDVVVSGSELRAAVGTRGTYLV